MVLISVSGRESRNTVGGLDDELIRKSDNWEIEPLDHTMSLDVVEKRHSTSALFGNYVVIKNTYQQVYP